MDGDQLLEQLYERITLVRSIGSRQRGELCVMSFVALLAGEGHTDRPISASPLIRNLAIPINDALPQAERQRLKPFAPRFLGTNDGRDDARVEMLRQYLEEKLLPQVISDHLAKSANGARARLGYLSAILLQEDLEAVVRRLLADIQEGSRADYEQLGTRVGYLLSWCMRTATTSERRFWYQNEAILLLDQLCDIGAAVRPSAIHDGEISRSEERLEGACLSMLRRFFPVFRPVALDPGTEKPQRVKVRGWLEVGRS